MNIIDLAVVAFLALGLIIGWYHGSVRAAANVGAFLLSLVIALSFHGLLAQQILKQNTMIPKLVYYSESDEFLGDVETVRTSVDSLTPEKLNALLKDANLPYPVDIRFRQNLADKAFADDGLTTIGQYLSMTIAHLAVNIGCFLLLFLLTMVASFIAVRALDVTLVFPVLRYCDGFVGGAIGLLLAGLMLFAVEAVLPLILSYVPFKELRTIVDHSATCTLFYRSNFILALMKGFIG